jgi:uncharacterized protein (DUF885 family)
MKIFTSAIKILLILIIAGCGSPSTSLHELFADYDSYLEQVYPSANSDDEDRSANALLPDVSLETLTQNRNQYEQFLSRLEEIPTGKLDTQDQISYRLFQRMLKESIEAFDLGHHLVPLNGWWDYHAGFAEQPNRMPFNDVQDYENYIAKLRAFENHNNQYITRLRNAIEVGWVRPKVVLTNYIPTVEALISEPETSRFMAPFNSFPDRISEDDRVRLADEGLAAVAETVMPAYQSLAAFLRDEYYAAAPDEVGISNLEGGRAYYEHLVRHYTTLDITPDEVHTTGLSEVARIRQEMDEVIISTGFTGTFEEFIHYLRTDPKFYAKDKTELLSYTSLIMKRMDGELPRFFSRLPKAPYGIREVPDYLAPRMTTAYYNSPARDGTRAGFYYVNTYDLPSRPLYEVEALSFHEAVPGHHLQLALQQELGDLPKFRQNSGFTVFVEGWALYSERLGLEMGFYTDPYSNFGRLTYEMWRALRLVVDTGIHYKGWSRQEAIDYMAANSALTLLNITNEVDRYIFWPGQALAYKTGEIKIRQLREQAESELGASFDIRQFHEIVLENGSITLEVLEERVLDWIARQQ